MGFFESFTELNKLDATKQLGWDPELKNSEFRKFILNKLGPQLKTIKTIAPGILPVLQKPQQLIYDEPDYYIAIDTYTYTYYVCYRNLLVIDIDFHKLDSEGAVGAVSDVGNVGDVGDVGDIGDIGDVSEPELPRVSASNETSSSNLILDKVRDYCQSHQELSFRIFKSRNGFHLFLVSQNMNYQSDDALQLMLDLECDFYYLIFCYWRGWSIRLNRKRADPIDQDLYQEIDSIGSAPQDQYLNNLVDLHYNLMKVFQTEAPNLMW